MYSSPYPIRTPLPPNTLPLLKRCPSIRRRIQGIPMQWRSTKTALKEQQISTLKSIISAHFQRHQAAQQQHILFPWSKIPIEQQQKSPFSAPKQRFQLFKLRCFCTAYAVHMQRWQQHPFSATTATARSGAEKALLECIVPAAK